MKQLPHSFSLLIYMNMKKQINMCLFMSMIFISIWIKFNIDINNRELLENIWEHKKKEKEEFMVTSSVQQLEAQVICSYINILHYIYLWLVYPYSLYKSFINWNIERNTNISQVKKGHIFKISICQSGNSILRMCYYN